MIWNSTKRYVFACVLGAMVSASVVARVSPGISWDNAQAAGFFALIGLTAQALAHRLPKGVAGSIGFIPFMSALLVAPSLTLVFAVGLAVLAAEVLQHQVQMKATFNVAQHMLAISVAVLVFSYLHGRPMTSVWSYSNLLPVAASFTTFLLVNTVLVSGVIAVTQHRKVVSVWRQI